MAATLFYRLAFIGLFLLCIAPFDRAQATRLNVAEELAYRVQYGSPEDVSLLLRHGGNPNGKNALGWPLVSAAAMRVDGEALNVLRILVEAGADLNQGGTERNYPVIIAARNSDLGMMRFLLSHDADPFVQDKNGMQPYDIAKFNGNTRIVRVFEKMAAGKIAREASKYSPERYHELLINLSQAYCESQYMYYYFKSGQDKHPKSHIEAVMSEHQQEIGNLTNNLQILFQLDPKTIYNIREYAAKWIYSDLEKLISNRNRRKHGVGLEEDRIKRCNVISAQWKKEFDAARKKMRAKRTKRNR